MQRTLNGPDKEWLSLQEVATWLQTSESTLQRLVRQGRFPRGVLIAPKQRRWNWLDAVAYAHLVQRTAALSGPEESEEPGSDK